MPLQTGTHRQDGFVVYQIQATLDQCPRGEYTGDDRGRRRAQAPAVRDRVDAP
jgi:hypothetical protein